MLEIVQLFIQRKEFFMNLLYQHLQISFISIVLAILIGGLIGIFMSEYKKISKPFMSIINFVYTIPSISMLGIFNSPFRSWKYNSDYCTCHLCSFTNGKKYLYRNGTSR